MVSVKKFFKNFRIIVLVTFLLLAIIAINPRFGEDQVAIRSVLRNSSASLAGIENPNPRNPPMSRERIESINGKPVRSVEEFYSIVNSVPVGKFFTLATNKGVYRIEVKPKTETIVLNETENVTVTKVVQRNVTINGTLKLINETINETVERPKTITKVVGRQDIGLKVYPAPKTNIRKGLDLTGGTRVLLKPEKPLSPEDMDIVIESLKQRLNVYGLSDIIVRPSKDLEGNQFILVEIAGANEEEVQNLLASQGKFEAKIGNETVFVGGKDITYVARSADRAGIDPQYGCRQVSGGRWACRFRFAITLSPEAAERHAGVTRQLDVITDQNGDRYLSQQLDLYLDNILMDSLNIGAELRGQATTDISISGSGFGSTRDEAILNTLSNMKRLQTILITGSLPVKLEIVQSNTISPLLGEEFVKNAILVGLFAALAVALVVYLRYRNWRIILPMLVTMASEVILLLGLAALIGWNIDLAAVAGIIIAVGTGVDDQIVITDETLTRKKELPLTWKQRIKRAFFIIMASYFTTVVAMIPLWFAGAGLLKGFATITIFGVTFGVFITRPAYAAMLEMLVKK